MCVYVCVCVWVCGCGGGGADKFLDGILVILRSYKYSISVVGLIFVYVLVNSWHEEEFL